MLELKSLMKMKCSMDHVLTWGCMTRLAIFVFVLSNMTNCKAPSVTGEGELSVNNL
jgi:hypothetical protein